MQRTRITLEVDVDLDPVPGNFHTPEQAERAIFGLLHMRIPHYDPTVKIQTEKPANNLEAFSALERVHIQALQMAKDMYPDADHYEIRRVARDFSDMIKRGR